MADRVTVTLNLAQFNARVATFVAASQRQADDVTLQVATDVLAETVENWPVDSGASRAAWWGPRQIAPATYQIGNPLGYAAVIEYGDYVGVGPKTAQFAGEALPGGQDINAGIYPTQVPQAPLRRALASNYQQLTTQIAAELKRQWGR